MRLFWLSTIIAISILSCNTQQKDKQNLVSLIPNDHHIVIRINNLESFNSAVKNNQIISEIEKFEAVDNLKQELSSLKFIQTN
ncbi:MAG: hypothetical protein AAF688_11165, partial [Bacteroidota bacterium]